MPFFLKALLELKIINYTIKIIYLKINILIKIDNIFCPKNVQLMNDFVHLQ